MNDQWREPIDRVIKATVEYLDKHPSATVAEALQFGIALEAALYGVPNTEPPTGLLGFPPLKR